MAPVLHEFSKRSIRYFFLHTGQHYSHGLSKSFFIDMKLRDPDSNLEIGSGTHSQQTARALLGIEEKLLEHKPDVVVVLGDTNAVLSAALAAVKLDIPVGHIEAGLRSYDMRMPEEHNRRLTDHISKYLFAPTDYTARILKNENVWGNVYITGNTVIDALESIIPKARKIESPVSEKNLDGFALLTLHRAENVDNPEILKGLVKGLQVVRKDIVFPAHPRTLRRLEEFNLMDDLCSLGHIHIVNPMGYMSFLRLLIDCEFVLTDSGGIQEEVTAPSLNKRVFVLRRSTERPEAVESGHATVVGTDPKKFPALVNRLCEEGLDVRRSCPYGEGDASVKIVDVLTREFSCSPEQPNAQPDRYRTPF
ncbi:MAG: UDP-N-acetylglucosamine 2-epimerase (non-hydrolyzing) [Candidatus Thorarchaeota archaeon]|nr:MAG: UDP-N-acetylglucosamine 2-epimerase (non-hydrolyzing) [Candidatus Thorarchaeota archaeon]